MVIFNRRPEGREATFFWVKLKRSLQEFAIAETQKGAQSLNRLETQPPIPKTPN
jgi:hypothetical protein